MGIVNPTLLLVEDTPSLAALYTEYLAKEKLHIRHVGSGGDALLEINRNPPNIILLDLNLPDMNGLDILRYVHEKRIASIVIIITAYGSINIAVEAMRFGCYDFIVKPFTSNRLNITIRNAVEKFRLHEIVHRLSAQTGREKIFGFIGSSPVMQAVYDTIETAASSKATIFITGESGTGKEVCADAIHRQSGRSAGPFIALNCGAIPKDLMESEIFGHVKGAFTGATSDRLGAASLAHGGTLFLDEICEMDLALQTKFLRFIQTGSFSKVGSDKAESVDVRFICATNRDPWNEVKEGRFREDLYYRMMVIPIELPPLKIRDGDVIAIARHFLDIFSKEEGKSFRDFSAEALSVLAGYSWPGNVRQLQNVIRQIVVMHDADFVTKAMLPAQIFERQADWAARADFMPFPQVQKLVSAAIKPLWLLEKEAIEQAITSCDGNVPKAAALLEVSASTLYRKKMAWDAKANLPGNLDIGSNAAAHLS